MTGGEILNRYFDNNPQPRQESYAEDVHVSKPVQQPPKQCILTLRAGAESGWDFSSRWFADAAQHIEYHSNTQPLSRLISIACFYAWKKRSQRQQLAGRKRRNPRFSLVKPIKGSNPKYCWNATIGIFSAIIICTSHQQKHDITAAGLFPLFVKIATSEQAPNGCNENTRIRC